MDTFLSSIICVSDKANLVIKDMNLVGDVLYLGCVPYQGLDIFLVHARFADMSCRTGMCTQGCRTWPQESLDPREFWSHSVDKTPFQGLNPTQLSLST